MNGHYNLLLCYLSALCTFARSALLISVAKRAGNLRFYIHHHLQYSERRCVYGGNGRAGKQQREGEKTIGTTYFSTSRYSNSAILARKRHNHVHLLRAVPAHDLHLQAKCRCTCTLQVFDYKRLGVNECRVQTVFKIILLSSVYTRIYTSASTASLLNSYHQIRDDSRQAARGNAR